MTRPVRDPAVADAELLDLIARGYPAGLAALYDRHAAAAYAHALRIVGDGPMAEAAVEDVFLQIWRGAAGSNPGSGDVGRWLFGLVHRASIDALRARLPATELTPSAARVSHIAPSDTLATA